MTIVRYFTAQICRRFTWQRREDFKECITRFVPQAESAILSTSASRPSHPDFEWGHGCRLLCKRWGANGVQAAFEMVRTGNDGELKAVLGALADQIVQEYSRNWIGAQISE